MAILVERADTRQLEVSLFNFAAVALEVKARPWRLAPGQYEMTLTPATQAGGLAAGSRSRKVTVRERGERIGLTVPPRQLLRLHWVQTKALPSPKPNLPDLAVGGDAIEVINPPLTVGRAARLNNQRSLRVEVAP